jgi:hypothetical protein
MLAQISSESPVGNLFLLLETALFILARNMGTRNDTRPRDTSQEVYRTEGKSTIDLNIAARVSHPCDAPSRAQKQKIMLLLSWYPSVLLVPHTSYRVTQFHIQW